MALSIQFTVGDSGAPQDGQGNYFNPSLSGKEIKVFREGMYQYRVGQNFILVPGTGVIVFFPQLGSGERIRIIAS